MFQFHPDDDSNEELTEEDMQEVLERLASNEILTDEEREQSDRAMAAYREYLSMSLTYPFRESLC
jgi:hypothetical protein